jgi:hypothetical protein
MWAVHVLQTRRSARVVLVALAAFVVVGFLVMANSTGSAAVRTGDAPATPANEALHPHPWNSTGCSMPGASIDAVPGLFDFHHACVHLGGCYQGLDRVGDPATIDRVRCDEQFRQDLVASCAFMHANATNWRARECRDTAQSYYEVVRSFGGPYYVGSGDRD